MSKTYEQLKLAIRDWLVVSQEDSDERLSDAVCGDILQIVRRDYLRRRESRLGEDTAILSITSGIPNFDYPADFSKPRKLWYVGSTGTVTVVEKIDKDQFDVNYPYSAILSITGAAKLALEGGGTLELEGGGSLLLDEALAGVIAQDIGAPCHYTIWAGQIILGKAPDAAYTMFLDYWGLLDDLQDDPVDNLLNQNRFTREAWEYLLFASLVKSTEYGIEDDRVALWAAEAKKFEDALDLEDARQHATGRRSQSREPG